MSSFLRSRRFVKFFLAGLVIFLVLFGLPQHASRTFRKDAEELELEDSSEEVIGTVEDQPTLVETQESLPTPTPTSAVPEKSRTPLPLGRHKFRSDGLLEVNQDGAHPIYELISRAEEEWEAKLERASKTLDEAVAEYRRRYGRAPPKGFDIWWKYVQENNVQLPDEYDQIYHDLEPFWGIEPADLLEIQAELELKRDSYTIGKNKTDDDVQVLTWAFQEGKYNQLIAGSREVLKLFKPIQELLPPFRMTLSPHDGPNRLSDYGVKSTVLEAAAGRTYVERASLPRINALGWVSACSPDSPARQKPINLDSPPPPSTKKTFIWDHVQTMDPCNHPVHLYQHGQFLSHNMGPTPQAAMVPEFSYCSTTIHHNIRIPTPYGWTEDIYPRSDDPDFDDKVDERLLWRGSITGMYHNRKSRWQNSHRERLVGLANELEGTVQVLPPNRTRSERIGELREIRKARINPAVMDIAFAGEPSACDREVCDLLWDIFPWRGRQSIKEAGSYKYVFDIDGNGWSGRFKRLITSNSLIFKSTIYPEWFADRVQPWLHYVPIQIDLSDLHDALLFFRGDGNGEGAHEDLGRKIAVAGREWSKTFWRREDLSAYFFRLTLEYARLMSTDRESMNYH